MVKNLHANAGDIRNMSPIPGSGRFLGEGNEKGLATHSSILESLLDCKDIQPVHPKGNQS